MLSKPIAAAKDPPTAGDGADDSRLLHDIRTLSKALSLDAEIPKIPPNRSISAPKSHPNPSKKPNSKTKKPSFWSNFNPIKSISSQFRPHRRFNCQFSLHVHSVDDLPPLFANSTIYVHWKRTTDPQSASLSTRKVMVFDNSAEFDEVLMYSCSVHGARNGPKGSAKYEAKQFMVSVKVVGHQDFDLGKNLIDLTRLLPLSLEELDEEEKRLGKWTTSFRLSGKAKGAVLNVSFGFSVVTGDEVDGDEKKVGRVGSFARSRDRSRSVEDVRVLHEVLVPSSRSDAASVFDGVGGGSDIGKLDGSKIESMAKFEVGFDQKDGPWDLKDLKGDMDKECQEPELIVVEKGVEIAEKDRIVEPELEKIEFRDEEGVEMIRKDQVCEAKLEEIGVEAEERVEVTTITKDQLCESHDSKNSDTERGKELKVELEEVLYDYGHISEALDSAYNSPSILEWEKTINALQIEPMTPDNISHSEAKANYRAKGVKSKSLGLDDETVASEFLSMLGIDHSPFGLSSDSDPESPRERLWKQFKNESISNANNLFGVEDITTEKAPNWIEEDFGEEFDLSSIVQEAEMELQIANEAIDTRSRAQMMEDAETEALMREWGLDEKAFHQSPPCSRSGFGSPIDLPLEEPIELPPLGEGLGPFVQTKDGGFLRSMSPSLFSNAKNNGSLIMQVSSPVVVPAEMGSGIMDILQQLASVGIEKLSMQVKKLMPLENVTGKTMQQIAWEAAPALESIESQGLSQHLKKDEEQGLNQIARRKSKKSKNSNIASTSGGIMSSECVSLEDLAPLAMDKIEALSIEGLRIQSGMTTEEPPSNISPQSIGDISAFEGKDTGGLQLLDVKDNGDEIDGLMGLSITLDEWMRLDSGIVDEEDDDVIRDRTSKIFAAHHARSTEMISGGKRGSKRSGKRWGLLGNNFTVALMVQLRDPLRNYEPVGAPMLSLIQVERVFVPPKPKIYSTVSEKGNSEDQYYQPEPEPEQENKTEAEEVVPQFKITEVHVTGIKTEPDKKRLWSSNHQQQSGSRWLLATGMGKGNKHPFMKSKTVSKSSPAAKSSPVTTTVKPGDTLWSISSRVHGNGAKWKELLALNPHIRNPDVILPNQMIRLQ